MERARLKLAVIFLLAALNIVLLGCVLMQAHQTKEYQRLTCQQVMTYLQNHGIRVAEETIPWETDTEPLTLDENSIQMGGTPLPEGGLPDNCEVETSRDAVTLLMDLVRGLSDLDVTEAEISAIQTGYRYTGEGDRGVLTPMWALETDTQRYYLNCATGEVTLPTE